MSNLLLKPEQQPSFDSWMTSRRPETKEELGNYLHVIHNVVVAEKSVCPDHQSALDFMWAVFNASSLDPDIFALAAKGTGKTLDLALLHIANSIFKPKCWTLHMGALQAQADRNYKYFSDELRRDAIKPFVLGEPLKSRTEFTNGARVEVVPGTIAQACLPGSQGIITDQGVLRLKKIVQKKLAVNVLSYSFERSAWEWKPITGWHDNGEHQDFMSLTLIDHRKCWRDLCATDTHDVLRLDGSKTKIGKLQTGDRVCVRGFVPSLAQKEIVLGLLLGDGMIDKHGRLSVVHGQYQKDYIQWIADQLVGFSHDGLNPHKGGFGTDCWKMRTSAHPWLRELRRLWYQNGKKTIPPGALDGLGELALSIWLMDDGTISASTWGIATHCWNETARSQIVQYFDGIGIEGKFSQVVGDQYSWRFSTKGSRSIDTITGNMIDVSTKQFVGRKRWIAEPIKQGVDGLLGVEVAEVVPVRLRGRTESNRKRTTSWHYPQHKYDLTVAENHNYCTGSGILVGNSGPHPHKAVIDEFDLLDYDVWSHVSKTPHESDGIPAQIILASTRFKKAGPVMRVIDDLGKNLKTFSWCILDAMAPCTYNCDDVPGIGKCPLFERKVLRQGVETTEIMCGGKAHEATGHLSYAQVLKEFLRSDQVSWGTLQLLEEPGSEGMFFPECDDVKHLSSEYVYVAGRPVYLGCDWGFADGGAACLGAWQARDDGLVYQFYELYGPGMTAADMLTKIEDKPWLKDVKGGWPDPSGKDQIETFRRWFVDKLGTPIMSFKTDNDRLSGWSAMRRRLRGPRGEVSIGWHTSCKNTWADIKGLSHSETKPEDCEKNQDHGADESRYFVRNYDKYKNLMRDRDETPDDAVSEQEKIGESILEHDIKEKIKLLKQSGISIIAVLDLEKQIGKVDRKRFLRALAEWYEERTLHGRMTRAGMTTYSEDKDDER